MCVKDDQKIAIRSSSSHIRNTAVFSFYESYYELKNGEQIIGVFLVIFSMNEGMMWEFVH